MRFLYRFVPGLQKLVRAALYLMREFLVLGMAKKRAFLKPVQRLAQGHLAKQVRDPKLRNALTPDFTIGCKRILISNDYYPAVAAPNAELVTAGIAEVRPHSIVDRDGVERPTDTIVLATGFHVTDLPIAEKICGRGGHTLAEEWADGMVSNRSAAVAGFPNLFLLVGPNVGVGHTSMVYMIESQVSYVDSALQAMEAERLDAAGDDPRGAAGLPRPHRREVPRHGLADRWLRELVPRQAGAQHHAVARLHVPVPQAHPHARPRELRRHARRRSPPHLGGGRVSTAADSSVETGSGSSSGTVLRRTAAVPTSDGAVLHATIDGADDAPVTLVLAHGWTLAQAAWDDVAELLMPRVKARASCA